MSKLIVYHLNSSWFLLVSVSSLNQIQDFKFNHDFGQINREGWIYVVNEAIFKPALNAYFMNLDSHIKGFMSSKRTEGVKKSFVVQVRRNPLGSKKAAVNEQIMLRGNYVIIKKGSKNLLLSKKISQDYLKNFKRIFKDKIKQQISLIIRQSALSVDEKEILKEYRFLEIRWFKINLNIQKAIKSNTNACVYRKIDHIQEMLNREKFDVCQTNNIARTKRLLNTSVPVKMIHKDTAEKILRKVTGGHSKITPLRKSGFFTIEKTEMGWVIDVNTGSGSSAEIYKNDSIHFLSNKEALEKIVEQILIRDMSGIIVIDCVNVKNQLERNVLTDVLRQQSIQSDKNNVKIFNMNDDGILVVIRQGRSNEPVLSSFLQKFKRFVIEFELILFSSRNQDNINVTVSDCTFLNFVLENKIYEKLREQAYKNKCSVNFKLDLNQENFFQISKNNS